MRIETIQRQDKPEVVLTAYLLDCSEKLAISTRPAVLIFPGGGYTYCSEREGDPVATAFAAEGYHAFVLRYTCGAGHHWPEPLADAQWALDTLRQHSADWQLEPDRIAAAGFSAGGHLAAALGTLSPQRPNALILGYPVIKANIGRVLTIPAPALDTAVDSQTPPTFIFSTWEDDVVPISNTISFIQALNAHHVPLEAHIFQNGPHGMALGKPLSASRRQYAVDAQFAQWLPLCVQWLRSLWGDFPADQVKPEKRAARLGRYGIDVMLGDMAANSAAQALLQAAIPSLADPEQAEIVWRKPIHEINLLLPAEQRLRQDQLQALDQQLKTLPLTV